MTCLGSSVLSVIGTSKPQFWSWVKSDNSSLFEEKIWNAKNIRDVLSGLTLSTGIPFTLLGRPISVQYDINRGVIEPENTPDHIRALITGKASRRSRE